MSVIVTSRLLVRIFVRSSSINLGPASFGFFNSIKAGRKKSTIIIAVVAIRVAINEIWSGIIKFYIIY